MTDTPDTLYHYCGNEAFYSIISNSEVWLTDLTQHSNDASEGTLVHEYFQKRMVVENINKDDQDKMMNIVKDYTSNIRPFSFCLSEKKDQLRQWLGYGQDGQGIAIGFNSIFFKNLEGYTFDEMDYDTENYFRKRNEYYRWNESLQDLINVGALSKTQKNQSNNRSGISFNGNAYDKLQTQLLVSTIETMFFKNKDFMDEQEWRIINSDLIGKFLSKVKTFKFDVKFHPTANHVRMVHPLPLKAIPNKFKKSDIINKVILGPKNRSNPREVEYFLHKKGFRNAKVFSSSLAYQ